MASGESRSFDSLDGRHYYDAQPFNPFKALESWRRAESPAEHRYLVQEAKAFQLYEAITTTLCSQRDTPPEVTCRISLERIPYYKVNYPIIDYDPEPGNSESRRCILLGDMRLFTVTEMGQSLSVLPYLQVYTMTGLEQGAPPMVNAVRHDLLALWEGARPDGKDAYDAFTNQTERKPLAERVREQATYVDWLQKTGATVGILTSVNDPGLRLSVRSLN